jgi:hypothetical protein
LYQNSIDASLIFADKQIQPLRESSSLMGVKMLVQETVSLGMLVIITIGLMVCMKLGSKGGSNSQNGEINSI